MGYESMTVCDGCGRKEHWPKGWYRVQVDSPVIAAVRLDMEFCSRACLEGLPLAITRGETRVMTEAKAMVSR